jgi:hypothetical protein
VSADRRLSVHHAQCVMHDPPPLHTHTHTHIPPPPPPPYTLPCRVLSLRCALADYLLQLSSDPTHPTTFRVAMPAVGDAAAQHGATPMPTLLLIKDGLLQVWGHGRLLPGFPLLTPPPPNTCNTHAHTHSAHQLKHTLSTVLPAPPPPPHTHTHAYTYMLTPHHSRRCRPWSRTCRRRWRRSRCCLRG